MFMKVFLRKVSLMIAVIMLLMTFTACATDEESAINNNIIKDIVSSDERDGNTNCNIKNEGTIDEEDGWLYFKYDKGLYKCKVDGTDLVQLYDSEYDFYCINVVDGWVYFREIGIYRIKTDGTDLQQVAAEDVRGGVHFVDGKIHHGSEYIYNYDGTEKERIYNKNTACAYTLNIVDGYIYFFDTDTITGEDKIFKMKLDGSDLQPIYDGRTDYMTVYDGWIYFENYEDKKLYKMKDDGTELELFVDKKIRTTFADNGWLFYLFDDCIYKIKTDGTQEQLVAEIGEKCDVQLHGEWIYYISDNKLYKVKIDGTQQGLVTEVSEKLTTNTEETKAIEKTNIKVALDHSFTTQFSETNAITYPKFTLSYPSNWSVTEQFVSAYQENIVLTNERGVTVRYCHIASKDELGGASNANMARVEVTEVTDSKFVAGMIQNTDYSDLGEFAVSKLKVTGMLNMRTDSDYTDVDGSVAYAVLPKSRIGVVDTNKNFSSEFAFWYGGNISLVAESPDGAFTEQEEKEVLAILSAFKSE